MRLRRELLQENYFRYYFHVLQEAEIEDWLTEGIKALLSFWYFGTKKKKKKKKKERKKENGNTHRFWKRYSRNSMIVPIALSAQFHLSQ